MKVTIAAELKSAYVAYAAAKKNLVNTIAEGLAAKPEEELETILLIADATKELKDFLVERVAKKEVVYATVENFRRKFVPTAKIENNCDIGRRASSMCKRLGKPIKAETQTYGPHSRSHNTVQSYPMDVLKKAFEAVGHEVKELS